jgi:hypothetical protein
VYGKGRDVYKVWTGNQRERDNWEDPDVNGRIILNGSSGSGMSWYRLD